MYVLLMIDETVFSIFWLTDWLFCAFPSLFNCVTLTYRQLGQAAYCFCVALRDGIMKRKILAHEIACYNKPKTNNLYLALVVLCESQFPLVLLKRYCENMTLDTVSNCKDTNIVSAATLTKVAVASIVHPFIPP